MVKRVFICVLVFFVFAMVATAEELGQGKEEIFFVKSIEFKGSTCFQERELSGMMRTKRRGFFFPFFLRGLLNEDILQQDIARIKRAYSEKGFLDVGIQVNKKILPNSRYVLLQVKIEEGISDNKTEVDQLKVSLQEKENAINLLTGYLEKVKQEKIDKETQVEALDKENKHVKSILDVEISKKRELENKFAELEQQVLKKEEENKALTKKLANINEVLTEKLAAIKRAEELFVNAVNDVEFAVKRELDAVELQPIAVSASDKEESFPVGAEKITVLPGAVSGEDTQQLRRDGKVIVVKEKLNFVITNIGEEDGVKSGMLFNICRDDEILATAKVIEVRKTVSALDITLQQEDVLVREGDIVKYSLVGQSVSFVNKVKKSKVA